MKLNIIVFKNAKINAFTTPNFTDLDPEVAAKQLERSLVLNQEDPKVIAPYKNLDMYCIGTFDDETGLVTQKEVPVLLLSPREICLMIEQKKLAEVKEKQEEVANV